MSVLRSIVVLGLASFVCAIGSPAQAQEKPSASVGQQAEVFPEGSKIAFVNLGRVAAISTKGKSFSKKLEELSAAKSSEVAARGKEVDALRTKIAQSESLLNDTALEQREEAVGCLLA